MKKKKLSALLLAFAMLLSLLPMGALAEEQPVSVTNWQGLVAAMETGGNVVLGSSLTATSENQALEVPSGKSVTLDLNGFTIDGSAVDDVDVVKVMGQLTLKDSNGGGMITGNGQDVADVQNGGSFTMEGGIINNNSGFGAVYVRVSGTFTVSGAPVIEGGVYLSSDTSGNHSSITIGGPLAKETLIRVKMVTPGVFTSGLSGKGTEKNFASLNEGYTVILDNGEAKLAEVDPGPAVQPDPDPDWEKLQDALSQNGTVKLEQNYTATSVNEPLVIHAKNNKMGTPLNVTLDLNGYTIDGSALAPSDLVPYDVLRVYGRLTLTDSSESGNGKIIADGEDDNIGYVIKIDGNRGRFTMTGGAITANGCEGAVYVQEDHQFTMTGGTITANGCEGAVFVDEKCTFSLSGDPVINGGVYLDEGRVITIAGPLTNPAPIPIGVSVRTWDDEADAYVGVPGVFTSGWSTYMSGKDPANYFTSGDSSYAVALTSGGEARLASPVTLSATPVAGIVSISPSGQLYAGDEVTLKAEAVPGYTFLGWYSGHWDNENWVDNDAAHPVCSTLAYTFTIMEDTELLAKYEANDSVSVTINGGSKYTINGAEKSDSCTAEYILGTDVTVAVDRTDFAYWANSYGKVLSRSPSYTFTVTGAQTVNAVFISQVQNVATLVFQSMYGQIIARQELAVGDSMTIPGVPVRNGYDPVGWDMDGDGIYDNVQDTLSAAIQRGLGKMLTINPLYTLKNQTYTVTVYGGTGGGSYNQNDLVTVTANTLEAGQKFSHWEEDGKVLSYSESYSFFAEKDVTLTAVFVDNEKEVEPVGTTAIINTYHDVVNKTLTFVSMSTVPEGCKINVAGIIATSDAEKADAANEGADFTAAKADFVRGDSWNGTGYRYTWTKGNVKPGTIWYVRAYLLYTDTNGNQQEVYGDLVQYSYTSN